MKKITSVFSFLVLLSTTLFAKNFFEKRYFELMVDVPFNVSNNTFGLTDFMKKDIVIDFTKIADEMTSTGFNVSADTNPNIAMNLNLPKFSLGFESGVEIFCRYGIGKGFFDFFGYGYDVNQNLTVDLDVCTDIFVTQGIKTSFKVNDNFRVEVNPTVFVPVLHVAPESAQVVLSNKENGDISMHMDATMAIYTIAEMSLNNTAGLMNIPEQALSTVGFDLAGAVHFLYFENLDLWGAVRVPIVPGRMNYKATYKVTSDYEGNIQGLISQATGSGAQDPNAAPLFKYDDPTTIAFNYTENTYYINRPFKFNLYADYKLIPNFIAFKGGAGIGVRNPFTSNINEIRVYPEYLLETRVGLGNVLVFTLSTEYTDQVFKHQLAYKFNLRLFEVNSGVSLQSADLKSSFKLAGVGGFVNCYIGF